MSPDQLEEILEGFEGYNLELKTAQSDFNVKKLHDYCAAISNVDGGYLIFGVSDNREVVGTKAFTKGSNKLAHKLTEHLGLRVKVVEVAHPKGRVLVFDIPRHYTGVPTKAVGGTGKYTYPIRDGESMVEMGQQTLQDIFNERTEDWSAGVAQGATMADLDEGALIEYRKRWAQHTKRPEKIQLAFSDMLSDIGLIDGDSITNAALLLFGIPNSVRRFIPDAEIIFEWRNTEVDTTYGDRQNWRAGFVLVQNEIWHTVNARNTVFRYQEGFTQRSIQAYDEDSVREAIVNAFVHRDYTISGHSIRIMLSPESFYIENPGRLMPGITLENILDKTAWRNRLLAESLEKVGIMERSSQGIDKIFRNAIENGKGTPLITLVPDPAVQLTIPARLINPSFVRFLERVINEKQQTLSVKEIIELEGIRTGKLKRGLQYADKFIGLGIIERTGRGRGTKYILSQRYYTQAQLRGKHARIVGLPKEVKRAIISEHLKKHHRVTSSELQDAMPDATPQEISSLLKGMRRDGVIEYVGASPRWGYWQLRGRKSGQ